MGATAVQIKERPILFSGPMVRAMLDGRKTQTRRVITNERVKVFAPGYADDRDRILGLCPYGRAGDHLWVRETWAPHDDGVLAYQEREYVYYRADDETKYDTDGAWHPSIFMPRWASRVTLEITNVRVERVQDISEADAIAEGLQRSERTGLYPSPSGNCEFATWAYRHAWDSLNAKRGYSWESNPWVWVIEFKRLEAKAVTA